MTESTKEQRILFLLLPQSVLVRVKSLNIMLSIALLTLHFPDLDLFFIFKKLVIVFFIFMFELDEFLSLFGGSLMKILGLVISFLVDFLQFKPFFQLFLIFFCLFLVDLIKIFPHPIRVALPGLKLRVLLMLKLLLQGLPHINLSLFFLFLCFLYLLMIHLLVKLYNFVPVIFFPHFQMSQWVDFRTERATRWHSCRVALEMLGARAQFPTGSYVSAQVLRFCHLKTTSVLKQFVFILILLSFGPVV